ncbi:MAG TPA: penicillin-binding protein 2 [Actinomycetota bacterium]|nr:penicillin-binding protein 2 [Actinomycetota bacterium]
MTEGRLGTRLTILAAAIAFFFAALTTRLWFLQVLAAEKYRADAQENRVQLIPIPAPRGQILDRNGEPLVTNRPSTVLMVDRRQVPNEEALLFKLSELLEVPVRQLTERLHDPDYLPYQPVPIWQDVPQPVAFYIGEHRDEFPGVTYETIGVRDFVRGPLGPHVLGYLGEISPKELKDPSFADHLPGQKVGRGGVEQQYERFLRGEDGWLKLEVDASGKVLQVLGRQEPIPGNDLITSLDWKIQKLAEDTVEDAVRAARVSVSTEVGYVKATAGAVVVLDPKTGGVLAMASYPTYDPRLFQDGLTRKEYRSLTSDAKNAPLINRAVAGVYPPASTFKPFIASAAIKAGYASLNGSYPCPPTFRVPEDVTTVFHNWTNVNLGYLSLAESLVQSCDTVFYDFGLDFYVDRDERGEMMQQHLRRWGFGRPAGIDLPGELAGRVPNQRWKEAVHEEAPALYPEPLWLPGDNINMSVGQGDMLVTPLQLANAYAAVANGGKLYRPQVGMEIRRPDGTLVRRINPEVIGRVPAKRSTLAFLRSALTGVVASAGGTATTAFSGFPLAEHPVAAKTGTAEVVVDGRDALHSWFAAMAPAYDPEYVVVAIVEEGGHGSEVAAPIVRRVLEGLLDLTPGEFHISGEAED